MARKLAIHLWKMACDNKPYIATVCTFQKNDG